MAKGRKKQLPRKGSAAKGSSFVRSREVIRDAIFDVGFNIGRQWIFDLLAVSVTDSDITGFRLSFEQYKKLTDMIMKNESLFWDALTYTNESDYYQSKMDEVLKEYIPEEYFIPFEKRYPDLKQITY